MGKLHQVLKEIEKILESHSYIRTRLKNLIKENDYTRLETKAKAATQQHTGRVPNKDAKVREAHPGKYNVVFISHHSKDKQILTKDGGVYYDQALNFYNYITDYGTASLNDAGYYSIVKCAEPTLTETSLI